MDIVFWGVLFFLATEREHQNEVTREYPIPAKMMEIGKKGNSEFKFKKKKTDKNQNTVKETLSGDLPGAEARHRAADDGTIQREGLEIGKLKKEKK